VTNYNSTVGIRDYSRKGRDDAGRSIIIPRWYQDLVTFQVELPGKTRFTSTALLIENKDKPLLWVGHDNPRRYEFQIFGMQSQIFLPLPNDTLSFVEIEVEGKARNRKDSWEEKAEFMAGTWPGRKALYAKVQEITAKADAELAAKTGRAA
jgi:hypothetical protein